MKFMKEKVVCKNSNKNIRYFEVSENGVYIEYEDMDCITCSYNKAKKLIRACEVDTISYYSNGTEKSENFIDSLAYRNRRYEPDTDKTYLKLVKSKRKGI